MSLSQLGGGGGRGIAGGEAGGGLGGEWKHVWPLVIPTTVRRPASAVAVLQKHRSPNVKYVAPCSSHLCAHSAAVVGSSNTPPVSWP